MSKVAEKCWCQDRPLWHGTPKERFCIRSSGAVFAYNILWSCWEVALKPLEWVLFYSIRFKFSKQDAVLNDTDQTLFWSLGIRKRTLSIVNFHESTTSFEWCHRCWRKFGIRELILFRLWDQPREENSVVSLYVHKRLDDLKNAVQYRNGYMYF